MRKPLVILLTALVFWPIAWFGSQAMINSDGRVKPTKVFTPDSLPGNEPRTIAPEDADTWRALGRELLTKSQILQGEQQQETLLEALDAYRTVLTALPKDKEALGAIGDISFEAQLFMQAANYYRKYLAEAPDDTNYKKRLASALTFMNEPDKSIAILTEVLSKEPNDFQALAYLAIAESQLGNFDKAKEVGSKALAAAPDEESRFRFQAFLNQVGKGERGQQAPAAPAQVAKGSDNAEAFGAALRNHPMIGSKLNSVTQEGTELVIKMSDFPMSAMPPFAKTKFFTTISGYPGLAGITNLRFVDVSTGAVMAEHTPQLSN